MIPEQTIELAIRWDKLMLYKITFNSCEKYIICFNYKEI